MKAEISYLSLDGDPRERGRQHGLALQDGIHQLYENFLRMMDVTIDNSADYYPKVFRQNLDIYINRIRSYVRENYSDIYEELQGIAEGARLDFDKILFLNCVAEIRRLRWPLVAGTVFGPNSAPSDKVNQGCTLFAVLGQATKDNKVWIGQNHDIEPFWNLVVFHNQPTNAIPEQLVLGYPGIIGECGINAAGLAFVASGILVRDQRAGVPAPIVCRKILEKNRLSDAVEVVANTRRTIGIHYLIAAPFGVVDIETSATEACINYITEPITACSNHILSAELKPLQLGYYSMDSIVRAGRMKQLLESNLGELDFSIFKAVLRDHADYPVSICRHVSGDLSSTESRGSVIFQPEGGRMLFTNGPPCQNPYQEFFIGNHRSID